MDENKELNFVFTVKEANTVLTSLAKLPYEISAELINKIQSQATAQLETGTPMVETEEKYSTGEGE